MTNVEVAATVAPNQLLDTLTINNIKEYSNDIDIIELQLTNGKIDTLNCLNQFRTTTKLNINANVLVTYRTVSQGSKGEMTYRSIHDIIKRNY